MCRKQTYPGAKPGPSQGWSGLQSKASGGSARRADPTPEHPWPLPHGLLSLWQLRAEPEVPQWAWGGGRAGLMVLRSPVPSPRLTLRHSVSALGKARSGADLDPGVFPRPNRRPSLQEKALSFSHPAGRSVGTQSTKVAPKGLWVSQGQRGHGHLLAARAQVSAGGPTGLQEGRALTKRQRISLKTKPDSPREGRCGQ